MLKTKSWGYLLAFYIVLRMQIFCLAYTFQALGLDDHSRSLSTETGYVPMCVFIFKLNVQISVPRQLADSTVYLKNLLTSYIISLGATMPISFYRLHNAFFRRLLVCGEDE